MATAESKLSHKIFIAFIDLRVKTFEWGDLPEIEKNPFRIIFFTLFSFEGIGASFLVLNSSLHSKCFYINYIIDLKCKLECKYLTSIVFLEGWKQTRAKCCLIRVLTLFHQQFRFRFRMTKNWPFLCMLDVNRFRISFNVHSDYIWFTRMKWHWVKATIEWQSKYFEF